jgi:hypothetical protein
VYSLFVLFSQFSHLISYWERIRLLLILSKSEQVDGLDWEGRLSLALPAPRDPRVVRLLLEAGARLSTEEESSDARDGKSGCEHADEVAASSQVCTGSVGAEYDRSY